MARARKSFSTACCSILLLQALLIDHRRVDAQTAAENVTKILAQIIANQDKKIRPDYPADPARVIVDIDVLGIDQISEQHLEFTIHCYFRQKWRDLRLRFEKFSEQHRILPLNAQRVLGEIWSPDTYIRNGKHAYIHRLTVPNRLLRIRDDGWILLSQRLTITARCPMNLKRFPMDTQTCPLEIGSLGYSAHDVLYYWNGIRLSGDTQNEFSQFKLNEITTQARNVSSMSQFGDKASVLGAHFKFVRQQGYFMLQMYVPCTMIVVLSWVSFWINKDAAIARCSLGVTTVLTLTTLRLGVRKELPIVEYTTALDVFMIASYGFVLAALVEYIVIHFNNLNRVRGYIRRRMTLAAEAQLTTSDDDSGATPQKKKSGGSGVSRRISVSSERQRYRRMTVGRGRARGSRFSRRISQQIRQFQSAGVDDDEQAGASAGDQYFIPGTDYSALVDAWSKFVFPALFTLFHIAYWYTYIVYWEEE